MILSLFDYAFNAWPLSIAICRLGAATPRVRDDVKIALTLELKRSASGAAEAYVN